MFNIFFTHKITVEYKNKDGWTISPVGREKQNMVGNLKGQFTKIPHAQKNFPT